MLRVSSAVSVARWVIPWSDTWRQHRRSSFSSLVRPALRVGVTQATMLYEIMEQMRLYEALPVVGWADKNSREGQPLNVLSSQPNITFAAALA